MNEVKVTPVTVSVPPVARTTSSEGIESPITDSNSSSVSTPIATGKPLPTQEADSVPSKVIKEQTEQAVTEVNQFVQSVQRDLHFSVDEDSGLTVIRVRDKESGELIRQIPEDIFLNLAQKLKDNQSIQLLDTHG